MSKAPVRRWKLLNLRRATFAHCGQLSWSRKLLATRPLISHVNPHECFPIDRRPTPPCRWECSRLLIPTSQIFRGCQRTTPRRYATTIVAHFPAILLGIRGNMQILSCASDGSLLATNRRHAFWGLGRWGYISSQKLARAKAPSTVHPGYVSAHRQHERTYEKLIADVYAMSMPAATCH